MTHSRRKLAGTLLLVALVLVYVLVATVVGTALVPRGNRIAEFIYYAIAGLAWVPPAGLIIRWMHRP
jgi:hypothetical protein